nr:integrase, catalytic region, zinc finger, CCHC-type, peptidase aspartic, catalytic [Tanacetum cinerariifolium]
MQEVVKKEIMKLLDTGIIYPITDSPWEKCHFMIKEGFVLGHKVSSARLEVDKAKIDVISKHPSPTNIKADHLSRIKNDESSDDSEVDDNFPGETLMEINTKDETWFVDLANYLVANIIPKGMTYQQKNKFFSDLKHYFWEEPYLFKMANLSEDIQSASFDTQPSMLYKTDFASWQQCIGLYCRGKKNGANILKSIDEGPFQIGMFRETIVEGKEGALHLGPKQPRVYSDLSLKEKERYNADIRATNILLQGFKGYQKTSTLS